MTQQDALVRTVDRATDTQALPRSLLACLPVLWTQVLFPGPSLRPGRWRWRSVLLLLILPGVLLYPCTSFYLFEPDEGRYAQISSEMLHRGEWIIPYLQSEPYLDKPPLLYWLVMACFAVLGAQDWAARLVPALAVHATVLLTYALGRRRIGETAALWGAVALALSPGFLGMGRLLLHDGLLALWVTVALFGAREALHGPALRWGWWLTAAVACGLGILTKGPVILLLVGPPLWLHRRLTGTGVRLSWRQGLAFVGLTLAVALPWYAALCLRMPEFARYFLWQHNVVRFLQPFDHKEPVWYYMPVLVLGLLPGSLLWLSMRHFLLSGDAAVARRRSPELGFLLLAGGWCVLFFSLSGSKLATYILPGFPPLALALGVYVARSRWRSSRWTVSTAAVFAVLTAVANFAIVPFVARERSPMCRADEVVEYCGDRTVPVCCFPRSQDSVAFYTGRDDFRSYRSKATPELLQFLMQQPRTVVLFTHYHSLEHLQNLLPPELQLTRPMTAGVCALAVVERRPDSVGK
jgi:4-amino-4-deoxy-L-arabinose transferase-like glycosyltransferase